MRVTVLGLFPLLLTAPLAGAQGAFTGLHFVDSAGDVNLDGCADLIVGRWIEGPDDGDEGWVIVYSGKTGEVLHQFRGEQDGSGYGVVVAGVGDLNDDGAGDFAIASPLEVVKGKKLGVVRIYNGRNGKELLELPGPQPDELFGFAVESAGDVDQDGKGDVVISAPLADEMVGKKRKTKKGKSETGAVYVYSGPKAKDLYQLYGEATGNRFGFSAIGVGDTNGDGFGDLLVGAPQGNYAILYSGSDGEPRERFEGRRGGGWFGLNVVRTGDTNQSGTKDFAIGAPWAAKGGFQVRAGLDGRDLWERPKPSDGTGWWYGTSIDGAGDVNADGAADLIVGDPNLTDESAALLLDGLLMDEVEAPSGAKGSGKVRVYDGKTGEVLREIEAPDGYEGFGLCVSSAGDVDQDGADDLLVGFVAQVPRAHVYSGRSGELLLDLKPETD